jgi:hypothetical protein
MQGECTMQGDCTMQMTEQCPRCRQLFTLATLVAHAAGCGTAAEGLPECPLCLGQFAACEIEQHASSCNGY